MTAELHRLIREHSTSDNEYKRHIDSLKSSVLTAFYTPPAITEALADVLDDYNVRPRRLLKPSAGHGAFIEAFSRHNADMDVMAFEKDLLTGKILAHLYPDKKVRTEGFERIEKTFNDYFDAAVSNIPFGDVAVFDPSFTASESAGRRTASKAIHNYFFLKGLDAVRDGGIVAFITSQGVMNSPRNETVRLEMLREAHLVSAIRLPNNLFTDYAGTEVGSDLIVLQKDTRKEGLTEDEKLFTQTGTLHGVGTNRYFIEHKEQIIYTSAMAVQRASRRSCVNYSTTTCTHGWRCGSTPAAFGILGCKSCKSSRRKRPQRFGRKRNRAPCHPMRRSPKSSLPS